MTMGGGDGYLDAADDDGEHAATAKVAAVSSPLLLTTGFFQGDARLWYGPFYGWSALTGRYGLRAAITTMVVTDGATVSDRGDGGTGAATSTLTQRSGGNSGGWMTTWWWTPTVEKK